MVAGGFLHERLSGFRGKLAVRAWCVLCGKASKGSHGGWFQWWGRCAYTVELVKPADPEGTEGVAWGGEAELQGAT